MKNETERILKLVAEGKLSPEDAAELIEALRGESATQGSADGASEVPPPTPGPKDAFKGFVDFLEGVEKDITHNVDWKNISAQIREGASKGVEAIKKAAEELKSGQYNFFYATESRQVELPLNIRAGQLLKLENSTGDITIKGGFSENRVLAEAKMRGNTPEEAKERAEEFSVMIEESDHSVLIRQPRQTGTWVNFTVELVAPQPIDLRTESGNVSVTANAANAKIVSQSGDVRLSGGSGLIEISVQSGNTTLEDSIVSSATIESKSGNVLARKVEGSVNARAASGDIRLDHWTGKTLAIESVSGDVSADIHGVITGQATIRTVNGDTNLAIAPSNDCRVSLSTIRGAVTCALPLADEAKTEQLITGKLGNGSGSLEVSGINGNINLAAITEPVTSTPE